MFKNILKFIINSLFLLGVFLVLTFISNINISSTIKVILLLSSNILYGLSIIFTWLKFNKISRAIYVLFIIFSICVIIYCILAHFGILGTLSNITTLKSYILSTEGLGVFIYILIQIAQVIFLPIPAAIICIVGSNIYGPLLGGLYCSIGILIGSYISFFIGKTFGYRVVTWIVGKENTDKYSEIIRKRGAFFLSIAFLLPMFPDDILCFIAGITNMKFKVFFWVTLITRPVGVFCMSYFGSGHLIPFTGWGIYAWIVILIFAVVLVYVTYRYQESMEKFVIQKLFKNRKGNKKY